MKSKNIVCYFFVIFSLSAVTASAEELTVLLYEKGIPPFSFSKTSNDKGIYLDILEEISKITGDKFILNYYPSKRKRLIFETGKMHIEPGVNPAWREKWKDISVYSIPFGTFTDVIFFRKGEKFNVTSAVDLKGKKIVTVKSFYYPGYEQSFENKTINRYDLDNELQLIRFLYSKERDADAGFINKDILLYYMKEYNMKFDIGNKIGEVPVMFRFHISKKHVVEKFNKALKTLINNGTVDVIFKKYQ